MGFNRDTGWWDCEGCGQSHPFLPTVPSQSAPYEFIHTTCPGGKDSEHTRGDNRHHLVDAQAVADWYAAHGGKDGKGVTVPDGYVEASQAHADAVAAAVAEADSAKKGKGKKAAAADTGS